MVSVMGMCGGLVGPKSENVEKALVLPLLFEGSRGPRVRQSREKVSEPSLFDVEKVIFLIKNPPRPLASRRVEALTKFQTLQTS